MGMLKGQKRRFVFLVREKFGRVLLGPCLRVFHMAEALGKLGALVEVHALPGSISPFTSSQIKFHTLKKGFTRTLDSDDVVVMGELLPARFLHEFMNRKIPFIWDAYGLSYLESMTFHGVWSSRRMRCELSRKIRRYRWLSKACSFLLVSNEQQAVFLEGLLQCRDTNLAWVHKDATSIVNKCVFLPMGIPDKEFVIGNENPYPEQIRDRPIFLWGGGIWNWFDTETCLEAFSRLHKAGHPALLFFLAGKSKGGEDHQAAHERVENIARSMGIWEKSIFFNTKTVGSDELPGYLEHCTAGIMGNSRSLESLCSWRSRYLDLIWANRPLIVTGIDPLAIKMRQSNLAFLGRENSSADMEALVVNACNSKGLHGVNHNDSDLRNELAWSSLINKLIVSIEKFPMEFYGNPPSKLQWLLYVYGY